MFGEQKFLLIGVGVAALALLVLVKKNNLPADVGLGLGDAAAKLAGGVVAGVAEGVGDQVGIPRTDAELCAQAKADGDNWAASKYCPAGDFISYMVGG